MKNLARRLLFWLIPALLAVGPCAWAQGAPVDVSALERRLSALGFDPGPVDGVFDGKTRSALRDFQRQQGLTRTGQPDGPTLAALRHPAPARAQPAASSAPLPRRLTPGAEAPPPKAAPVTPVETEALPAP